MIKVVQTTTCDQCVKALDSTYYLSSTTADHVRCRLPDWLEVEGFVHTRGTTLQFCSNACLAAFVAQRAGGGK